MVSVRPTLDSGTPIHTHSFFFLCPGEDNSDLIRHFLIESSAKGVHLKGADEEPYFGERLRPAGPGVGPALPGREAGRGQAFSHRAARLLAGSLSAFVCQHSIMALALPCKLSIPQKGGCGPQRGSIGALGLCVPTTKAPSGHISPYLWISVTVKSALSSNHSASPLPGLRRLTFLSLCFLLYKMGTAVIIPQLCQIGVILISQIRKRGLKGLSNSPQGIQIIHQTETRKSHPEPTAQ